MKRALLLAVLLLPACKGVQDQHPSEAPRPVRYGVWGGSDVPDPAPGWPETTK